MCSLPFTTTKIWTLLSYGAILLKIQRAAVQWYNIHTPTKISHAAKYRVLGLL